ncbi:Sphingomyelin phosphodiesterase [Gossypium arboreum]|uniref:Sphingomyelin phosphodiesterase n=1 Tax=Gossypium arboreum TaxID=29729 RepID=A0A0B0NMP5_GOSAR|nr:Sphingomyelin phosphodiesterase [Gossypium arboreum]
MKMQGLPARYVRLTPLLQDIWDTSNLQLPFCSLD